MSPDAAAGTGPDAAAAPPGAEVAAAGTDAAASRADAIAAGAGRAASPLVRAGAALAGLSPKWLIVFLITLVLAVGEWRYHILGGYERLAITLGVAMGTELALSRLVRGRFVSVSSAYITGISLALLTKPQSNLLWPFALGAFLAIASKYVLRYRGRHLWNPSNFAISLLVLLAADQVAILSHQWGNDLPTNAVIWFFGLLIVTRARVLHITAAYVLSFLALAGVRHWLVGAPFLAEVAPITGPMYQLFIFFMITDPRTTVSTRRGRIVVAVVVALVEFGIRLAADHHVGFLGPLYYSPPILALFFVGPAAMWIDLRRKARRAEAPAPRRAGQAVTPATS